VELRVTVSPPGVKEVDAAAAPWKMPSSDLYVGWSLTDRLQMLAFEAELKALSR
jgi:hypothetical protein